MAKTRRGLAVVETPSWSEMINVVQHQDCVAGMKLMPAESVEAIHADPPFNLAREYAEHDDDQSPSDYLRWTSTWLDECVRVMKPTASLWICISEEYVSEIKIMAERKFGLTCDGVTLTRSGPSLTPRHHIIWFYSFGTYSPKKLTRSHTHILHFVKDLKQHTWNPDAVRLPSARQTEHNDKRANPDGRLPDDTWILRPINTKDGFAPHLDVQYASRVCGTFKERFDVDNQMPEALVARILRLCSNPGDLILSPFAGSGTDAVVAKKLGRRFITFETSAACVLQAQLRVEAAREGDPFDAVNAPPKPKRVKVRRGLA